MLGDILTVFWRDWVILRRRLWKFVFSRMITPVLYLVAFGWGIGRSVQVNDGNYLDFIVPGILALNSMTISFNAVGTPVNMARLYHKTLEEYLVAPIKPMAYVFGKILAGALRGMISSAIILGLAYLFGSSLQLSLLLGAALLLNCLVFAAMGFAAAMLLNTHEDMASFSTYVLLPMSFLCATFFSTDRLPALVRWCVELLPLTQASHILRSLGGGETPAILSWILLELSLAVLVGVCVWTMERIRR